MTTTEQRRTVRLTTSYVRSGGRTKPVVVVLTGDTIELRLKGERRRVRLSAAMAYTFALNSWVQSEKARRKADRAARRKG